MIDSKTVHHEVSADLSAAIADSCDTGLAVIEEHPAYPTARTLRIVADWLAKDPNRYLSAPSICGMLRAVADEQDPPEDDL